MKEFWELLKDLSSVEGWIIKTATGGPIVQFLSGWGPPWPPQQFATAFASVVAQVFVVMWALTFWRKWSKPKVRRIFGAATLAFAAISCAYIALFAIYTRYLPEAGKHVVIGTTLKEGMADFIRDDYDDVLSNALEENKPDFLYQESGLVRNRVLLLLTWIAAYLCMSAGMTSFVSLQNEQSRDQTPGRRDQDTDKGKSDE